MSGVENLVPLFKLVPGIATSSDGLACAKLGGLPDVLLERAHEIMTLLEQGRPIAPAAAIKTASAQSYGPGSIGHELLSLFLETPSFVDAEPGVIAVFKDLIGRIS